MKINDVFQSLRVNTQIDHKSIDNGILISPEEMEKKIAQGKIKFFDGITWDPNNFSDVPLWDNEVHFSSFCENNVKSVLQDLFNPKNNFTIQDMRNHAMSLRESNQISIKEFAKIMFIINIKFQEKVRANHPIFGEI